jgi:hypothetical protein
MAVEIMVTRASSNIGWSFWADAGAPYDNVPIA